jgi:hypothetical protein
MEADRVLERGAPGAASASGSVQCCCPADTARLLLDVAVRVVGDARAVAAVHQPGCATGRRRRYHCAALCEQLGVG